MTLALCPTPHLRGPQKESPSTPHQACPCSPVPGALQPQRHGSPVAAPEPSVAPAPSPGPASPLPSATPAASLAARRPARGSDRPTGLSLWWRGREEARLEGWGAPANTHPSHAPRRGFPRLAARGPGLGSSYTHPAGLWSPPTSLLLRVTFHCPHPGRPCAPRSRTLSLPPTSPALCPRPPCLLPTSPHSLGLGTPLLSPAPSPHCPQLQPTRPPALPSSPPSPLPLPPFFCFCFFLKTDLNGRVAEGGGGRGGSSACWFTPVESGGSQELQLSGRGKGCECVLPDSLRGQRPGCPFGPEEEIPQHRWPC